MKRTELTECSTYALVYVDAIILLTNSVFPELKIRFSKNSEHKTTGLSCQGEHPFDMMANDDAHANPRAFLWGEFLDYLARTGGKATLLISVMKVTAVKREIDEILTAPDIDKAKVTELVLIENVSERGFVLRVSQRVAEGVILFNPLAYTYQIGGKLLFSEDEKQNIRDFVKSWCKEFEMLKNSVAVTLIVDPPQSKMPGRRRKKG